MLRKRVTVLGRGVSLGWLLLAIAVVGVAAAWAVLFFTGSFAVTSGSMGNVVIDQVVLEAPVPPGCAATPNGNSASVAWPGALPGSTCRLHIRFHATQPGLFYDSNTSSDPGLIVNDSPGPGVECGYVFADTSIVDEYVDVSLDAALSSPGTPYAGQAELSAYAVAPTCP